MWLLEAVFRKEVPANSKLHRNLFYRSAASLHYKSINEGDFLFQPAHIIANHVRTDTFEVLIHTSV